MVVISFLCFLCFFAAIGVMSVRASRNNQQDYYLASQSIKPWLVGLSAVATNNSGYMFIGVIGYTYATGLASIWLMIGWLVGDFLGSLFIHRKFRAAAANKGANSYIANISLWQGVDMRVLQRLLALLAFTFLLAYASAQLVAGSKALMTLLDWPAHTGAIVGAVIVLVYCWAGGIRASIWTDAAQSVVMIVAMAALLYTAAMSLGGIGASVERLQAVPNFMDWFPKDLAVPGVFGGILFVVGWLVAGFSVVGQPHIMVRFMTLEDNSHMNRARVWYYLWFTSFYFMATAVGMLSRVLLPDVNGFDAELALPQMALQLMHPAMVGLILAGVFAATMSTADSLVLSCSAIISNDLGLKAKSLTYAKISTVVVTFGALCWALLNQQSVFDLVVMSWSTLGSAFAPLLLLLVFRQSFSQSVGVVMVVVSVVVALAWRWLEFNQFIYEGAPAIAAALLFYAGFVAFSKS